MSWTVFKHNAQVEATLRSDGKWVVIRHPDPEKGGPWHAIANPRLAYGARITVGQTRLDVENGRLVQTYRSRRDAIRGAKRLAALCGQMGAESMRIWGEVE